jgi:mono/diheme cytochrome c family protein
MMMEPTGSATFPNGWPGKNRQRFEIRMPKLTLLLTWFVTTAALPLSGAVLAAGPVEFERDVRPILADKCFACHGSDTEHREGGLRLDERPAALVGGESGDPAIRPGKPAESELVRRIESTDDSEVMPPPASKKELSPEEKKLLARWIGEGAKYQQHWAFVAPKRPATPPVKNTTWPRSAIDQFILARLEQEGLSPSPEADRITLLRRLTLDLTGLPPTIAEVDAFLADGRTDAYQRVVERLLASPHYGERWGRLWLDGARYSDSDGYEKDKPRFVWAYRDWVVAALNRDLPYDQFVIDQIAGDLLPQARQDQLVATGFLRNSMINEEGGIDPEQFRMEAMFDRMDALGKSVLALTIQCAQCHNHKYDPLSQEDYYRMFAFLNDAQDANIAVYTADEQRRRASVLRNIAEIEADLQHRTPDWREQMAQWEASVRGDQPAWTVVRPDLDTSGGQKHYLLDDGSVLAAGYAPTKHETVFSVKTEVRKITAVRLELLNDPSLPLSGPGRSIWGTCALSDFKLEAAPIDGSAKPKTIKIASATADVNPTARDLDPLFDDKSKKQRTLGPVDFSLDGKDDTAWTTDLGPGRSNVPRKAVFVLDTPLEFPHGAELTFKLSQKHGGWNSDDNQNNNLGRFRFSVTTAKDVRADPLPAPVRRILAIEPNQRTPAQTAQVFRYWRTTVDTWREANDRIEQLWKDHPRGTSQLVMLAMRKHRPTSLLARGDFLKPLRAVNAGTPALLPALAVEHPTRLDFARWLVNRQSPTAARAAVNRVWQTYFGTGLVGTSEDFGMQGETPSHRELLDWLAVEFMDRGWRLKDLHRQIVTTATYRQSSRVPGDALARDPQNRLLARGARFRLEAEVVRDIALASSGLLNPKLGGPSVYPPAPGFLFLPPASYGPKVWKEEQGPDRYRRALYTFRFRSVPYPALQTFDAPNGDSACIRRARSNTPLQALVTLNEPVYLECARALARDTLDHASADDRQRLVYAFRKCVARSPDEQETNTLLKLLSTEQKRFSTESARPWELAADDPEHPPTLSAGRTPAELAAWTAVSRVLLNLDETITRE